MAHRREIKDVREVLYDRKRMRELRDHLSTIEVLMNLDPATALPPEDSRVQGGAGPTWVYPANGEIDVAVLEAADRCEAIAGLLMQTRRELGDVGFDRSDKNHLRKGLQEQAKSWQERAAVWRAPTQPDVEAAVDVISDHFAASAREFKKVKKYLKEPKWL